MPLVKPKVRVGLTVVELDGEAVITTRRPLHHLNPTATIVFGLWPSTTMAGADYRRPSTFRSGWSRRSGIDRRFRKASSGPGSRSAYPEEATPGTRSHLLSLPSGFSDAIGRAHCRAASSPLACPARRSLALLDAAVVVPAYLVPLVLRFNGGVPSELADFWILLPAIVLISLTTTCSVSTGRCGANT